MSTRSSGMGPGKLVLPLLRRTAADAEAFAEAVHTDQKDKAGYGYIYHLDRVANRVYWLAGKCPHWTHEDTDLAQQIAWLHDTIEDTWVGARNLLDEGFKPYVVSEVQALTKPDHPVPYDVWIARLVDTAGLPTILVKLADVEDNSDPERLALLPEETRERLLRKYEPAKELLRAAARQKGWQG